MYYCQYCGTPYMNDEAVICVRCKAPRGKGSNFCHGCGGRLSNGYMLCMTCGVDNTEVGSKGTKSEKSKVTAGLLGLFLGDLGIHNFYLGYTGKGVAQLLLTLLGLLLLCIGIGYVIIFGVSIWALIESIMILCGSISKDGYGNYLE